MVQVILSGRERLSERCLRELSPPTLWRAGGWRVEDQEEEEVEEEEDQEEGGGRALLLTFSPDATPRPPSSSPCDDTPPTQCLA